MEDSVPKFETQTESTLEVHRHLVHWWSGPENVLELHSTEKRKFHTWRQRANMRKFATGATFHSLPADG
jgi:hypothetical protein